jgi:DNA-binding NarL/FixJ family response regulator
MRLLICDAQGLFDAMGTALSQTGYTVVATALDPHEAVDAAREHQPDACLLDVNFLQVNGLSALALIHDVSAGTKMVMLSGSLDHGLMAQAITEGASGLVAGQKPVGSLSEALDMAFPGDLPVDTRLLHEILRPQDTENRRDFGRPDRRDAARLDRRVTGRPARSQVGRPDRRSVDPPDR